jgi:hypothetical protein
MQNKLKRYWKVITWCVLIFTVSSIPTLPKVGFIWWDFLLKKGAHIFEYAILFTLTYKALNQKGNWKTPFLFGLTFALSDEYHQSFVLGRSARFLDIGFDSLGLLIAYWKLRN